MDKKEIGDLPNEILMRIFEYLNYGDLQDASLVCHLWYDLTHTNRFLPSLSIVKVPKLHKDEDFEFLNNTKNFHNYKNWSIEDYEQLLLNEKSKFHQRDSIKFLEFDYRGNQTTKIDLIEILLQFKNLEELKLDVFDTRDDAFKNRKITHNLKSLTISYCQGEEKLDLIRYLDLFSGIESLKIEYIPLEQKDIDFIVSKFGRNLKQLHLIVDESGQIIKLSNLNLKKLKCNSVFLKSSNFEEFIKTQKDLVSLDISGVRLAVLNDEFIKKIIENLKNLEELKVKCKDDSLFKIMKLKNLKKLHATWIITRDIQELYQGVSNGENNVLYELRVSCGIETEILSTFFKINFPNLRVLVIWCKVVMDSLLQLIFKNCTNLFHLSLGNCTQISDKSITGMNCNEDNGEKGVSIANLKGLRLLDLSGCNITDFSLEFGLKFLELRELNLMSCRYITKKGLEHLEKNCPSIARLHLSIDDGDGDVYKKFRRIKGTF